jgi:hypothetical protein
MLQRCGAIMLLNSRARTTRVEKSLADAGRHLHPQISKLNEKILSMCRRR